MALVWTERISAMSSTSLAVCGNSSLTIIPDLPWRLNLNFDGATGYLVGEANKGLNYMFTFMNFARLGTGLQGLAHSELAFQNSLAYSRDRLQMRSLTGPKNPSGPADPIIVHPDVRRMLMLMRSTNEAMRAIAYVTGADLDRHHKSPEKEDRDAAIARVDLLTPVIKGWCTEMSQELTSLGIQVHGGMGYAKEYHVERLLREVMIARLAPVSPQLILCNIAEKALGLPKSY